MFELSNAWKIAINILLIIISLIIGYLFILYKYLKREDKSSFMYFVSHNKYVLFTGIAFALGIMVRVIFLDLLPGGLNQDEASAGYDAYSIMMYGVDRNGMSYPVHLIAWGSGQNALYSYMMIPFIFALGVNELSLRLPMAVAGCISLYLVYKLLKERFDEKTAFYGLAFIAICPWHIMKSRWGLESNLFPEMVLLGVFLLLEGIRKKNYWFFFISAFVLALSSYSYGTSYFFLFFFIIAALIYLLIKKKIKWYNSLIYLGIVGITCIPIMLFIYINTFDKESISLLWFTIPKLTQNRFQTVTNIFSSTFFKDCYENLINGVSLLFTQNDYLPWNSIPYFGIDYMISIPFAIVGLFYKDQEKENRVFINILRIWFTVSILMMCIISPNINRINITFIPVVIFSFLGLKQICSLSKKVEVVMLTTYTLSFAAFLSVYCGEWNNRLKSSFFYSFGDAVKYTETIKDYDNCYVTTSLNQPYIFVLYYTKYNTNDYISTVEKHNPGASFESIKSFGNYYFYLPSKLEEGNVYILYNGDNKYSKEELSNYKVTHFYYYYVIDATK